MLRLLRQFLDSLRPGARVDRRLKTTHAKHAQFVSFLESSGYRTHNPDRYEQSLRRRRAVKGTLFWLSAAGASWVVIESAKALTLF